MKKVLLALFIIIISAGFLFSKMKMSPMQKKIMPAIEKVTIDCYKECKKINSKKQCNNGIDDLEEEVRAMFDTAKTKKVDSADSNVKKAALVMSTTCPKEGKRFVKAFKALK